MHTGRYTLKALFSFILGLGLITLPTVLLATAVSDATDMLMTPTAIITKMVIVACYMVGVGLVIFSIAQYKQHKQSPKLVPLSTPILLLFLGVICLLIPYVSVMSGESGSAAEVEKREGTGKKAVLPRLPDPGTKKLPGPGRYTPSDVEDQQPSEETYDDYEDSYEDEGGGHWSDNYD